MVLGDVFWQVLWRPGGPLRTAATVVGIAVGLLVGGPLVLFSVTAAVVAGWHAAFPPQPVWADRAADATCTVEWTATGIAAVIHLPLEPVPRESTPEPLGVTDVQFVGGSNAVGFHIDDAGIRVSGGELVVPVQALDPDQDFSVTALAVTGRDGGDKHIQTFRLGMTATAGATSCEIGASSSVLDRAAP